METWQKILQKSITTPAELKERLACDITALEEVIANFPMRINPYFLNLIKTPGDPIYKQVIPDSLELQDSVCIPDPLGEEELSPVPNLVHKYPDRALLLVHNSCAAYCRFCTRKRKVGTRQMCISEETLQQGYKYLGNHSEIKEILISGGDPLLMFDDQLETILKELRKIDSLEVIRIGTRVPSVLPMRVTKSLTAMLRQFHPLYINTHFNHPRELTSQAAQACNRLADAGIPLGCQTVLLRGINDDPVILKKLFRGLLRLRVKPYYLFQADLTRGTNHFRTSTKTGITLMKELYGHLSGMAIPTYALDGPGGAGKIPLTPDYILNTDKRELLFTNFQGKQCRYPEIAETT